MAPIQTVSSIKLPNSIILAQAANKSKAHRTLVTIALNRNLTPVLPEREEIISLTLNMPVDLSAKVQNTAKQHGMTVSAAFAALAKAGLLYINDKEAAEKGDRAKCTNFIETRLLVNKNDDQRPLQKEFFVKLAMGLHLNKAVMVEASTGVGKGRAIISAAVLSVKEGKHPVLICAPTLKVLSQLYLNEYIKNPIAVMAARKLSIAFLPGKQEFVNEVRLREHLKDHPCPAVEQWVDAGGPVLEATALVEMARHAGIKLSWLTSDLRIVADKDLRADDFCLRDDDKNNEEVAGAQNLIALIRYAKNADIVFCTHTMLVRMSMSNWANLPAIAEFDPDTHKQVNSPVILIDEAHMFEEAVSSATSSELSLSSLASRCAKEAKTRSASSSSALHKLTNATRDLMTVLQNICEGDNKSVVLRSGTKERGEKYNEVTNSLILSCLQGMAALMKKRGGVSSVERIDEDRQTVAALIKGLETGNNRVQVSYSPQRKYPSLLAGKASVNLELSRIWAAASGGVGLVSATLWMPDWTGTERINYMREILCIPLDRIDAPASIVWPEIYQIPTLYLPHREIAAELIPPAVDQSDDQFKGWCDHQGRVIAQFNKDCVGGTLVLCTSYVQVRELKEVLIKYGIEEGRIVENSGRLVDDQAVFTRLHRNGMRPIWIALGPAWTGVDLVETDENGIPVSPKSKDTLLTDLIITRLPIGLNRTITMESRIAYNFRSIGFEAMLRLKQGLGRLIRHAGVKDRRILVLDGRLTCNPDLNTNFMKTVVVSVHALLDHYKKRAVIR